MNIREKNDFEKTVFKKTVFKKNSGNLEPSDPIWRARR
jgi:hypothetical protein